MTLKSLLYSNRLKELNFCGGRGISAAKDMHYFWQQCIVCLPSIDFELEMLVHCIVNGMRFYAIPLSYVSSTDINLATVIFPFRKVPYKETGLEISVLFVLSQRLQTQCKPLLREK